MLHRHRLGILLAVAPLFLCAETAEALIVHEDKIVRAWPDEQARADGLLASLPDGFYPRPSGVVWGLTILVDFSDVAPEFTADQVRSWLMDPGYSVGGVNGSIRDYFLDNSNGMVDFRNDVVGFIRASQPKSYYEAGSYARARELVEELIDKIDGMVDFSKYDNDGDGRTEAISIVYAGPQETFGQGLWPHAGSIGEDRDGVRLNRYQMTQMGNRLGLYTFSHEIGHMLFGWPDLYGFGNYCIMGNASSQTNPVGINDLYRADQGWIPVVDITQSTNKRFEAIPNDAAYRYVNPQDSGEWFFWYNQRDTGRWSTLRGNGMLIMHFDHSLRRNDPPNPLSLAVVQADGLRELDQTTWPSPGSEPDDFYPSGGNTEFSQSTTPASLWNDGSSSGLRIYEISESDEVMTFAVGHGEPDPITGGVGGMAGAATGGSSGQGGEAGAAGGAGVGGTGAAGGVGGTGALGGVGGTGAAGGVGGTGAAGGVGGPGATGGVGGTGVAGNSGVGETGGVSNTGSDAGFSGGPAMQPPADPVDGGCACRSAVTRAGMPGGVTAVLALGVASVLRRRRRIHSQKA